MSVKPTRGALVLVAEMTSVRFKPGLSLASRGHADVLGQQQVAMIEQTGPDRAVEGAPTNNGAVVAFDFVREKRGGAGWGAKKL